MPYAAWRPGSVVFRRSVALRSGCSGGGEAAGKAGSVRSTKPVDAFADARLELKSPSHVLESLAGLADDLRPLEDTDPDRGVGEPGALADAVCCENGPEGGVDPVDDEDEVPADVRSGELFVGGDRVGVRDNLGHLDKATDDGRAFDLHDEVVVAAGP